MAAPLNFDGVPGEALRRRIDPIFRRLADGLEAAYYDAWRQGKSAPWHGYDVQETREQSKALFDRLHGAIWHLHTLALDKGADLMGGGGDAVKAALRLAPMAAIARAVVRAAPDKSGLLAVARAEGAELDDLP